MPEITQEDKVTVEAETVEAAARRGQCLARRIRYLHLECLLEIRVDHADRARRAVAVENFDLVRIEQDVATRREVFEFENDAATVR